MGDRDSPLRTASDRPDADDAPVTVVVSDDHPIVLSGVRQLFAAIPRFDLVGVATTGAETVSVCADEKPRLLLLDLRLPDLSATTVCHRVRSASPSTVIAVWSAQPDALALRGCLRAGATACLIKDTAERDLLSLLIRAAAGHVVIDPRMSSHLVTIVNSDLLSVREHDVLRLMARGLSTPEIADQLGVSVNTVKTHRRGLLVKLGARNRVEALIAADERGLLS